MKIIRKKCEVEGCNKYAKYQGWHTLEKWGHGVFKILDWTFVCKEHISYIKSAEPIKKEGK